MTKSNKPKYLADWNQKPGTISKSENEIRIYPHDLIALVHKKKGLDQAGKLATKLLTKKYDKIFEDLKA